MRAPNRAIDLVERCPRLRDCDSRAVPSVSVAYAAQAPVALRYARAGCVSVIDANRRHGSVPWRHRPSSAPASMLPLGRNGVPVPVSPAICRSRRIHSKRVPGWKRPHPTAKSAPRATSQEERDGERGTAYILTRRLPDPNFAWGGGGGGGGVAWTPNPQREE